MSWLSDLLRGGGGELGWDDLVRRIVDAIAALRSDGPRGETVFPPDVLVRITVPEAAAAAAAIVIDVDTGEVLARVQVPDYDPNEPSWQDRVLDGDAAFLRRFRGAYGEWPDKIGVAGMFQAGSVGKLFTAVAAVAAVRAGAAGSRFECRDADAQGREQQVGPPGRGRGRYKRRDD